MTAYDEVLQKVCEMICDAKDLEPDEIDENTPLVRRNWIALTTSSSWCWQNVNSILPWRRTGSFTIRGSPWANCVSTSARSQVTDMAQQWILVTGGSRGIGRALVTGLAQSGNVVFTGRDEAAINATRAASENSAHRVQGYVCDGNDASRVEQLAQALLAERGHRKRLSTMPG